MKSVALGVTLCYYNSAKRQGDKIMKKEQLIKRIEKLEWSDILYGYKNEKLININGYDKDFDLFLGYDENCKSIKVKFEELPSKLFKA